MEEKNDSWFEEELVRELLDDETPFFVLPEETTETNNYKSSNYTSNEDQAMDMVTSAAFLGPTIEDIENALSVTNGEEQYSQSQAISKARISLFEGGFSNIENKYTLKIKSCGNGMADDGYKWRKYGQKTIKNSSNQRSYFKCTNPRCSAKKQVERSCDDPETLIITYEGLHLHFSYPFFLLNQPHQSSPHSKKQKKTDPQTEVTEQTLPQAQQSPNPSNFFSPKGPSIHEAEAMSPQGLLEDVVPLMIRNPTSNSNNNVSSNTCSSSSYWSPPTSPSSLSCSP